MTTRIVVSPDRVDPLIKELDNKVKVVDTFDECKVIEITIDDALDILSVYHAGIRYGMDKMRNH